MLSSIFISEQQVYLEKINIAFDNQDWVLLNRELHTLEEFCSTPGAVQAEKLSANKQFVSIKPIITLLEQEIIKLTEILVTKTP